MARFAHLANDLSALIDGIPFGASSWRDVVVALSEAFPGSFAATHNKNFAKRQMNSMEAHNMEERFLYSYRDHFAAINPWVDYWSRIPAGKVAASEDVAPARLFKNTEFYNDWLLPQKDMEAASGLKIEADKGESIQLLLHYPLRCAPEYDPAAVRLLESIKGNLNRVVEFARAVRSHTETAVGSAALVSRGDQAAFVVGNGCHLIQANDAAEFLFQSGAVISATGAKVCLRDKSAQAAFEKVVTTLCRGEQTEVSSISFGTPAGRWHLSFAAIGTWASTPSFGSLLPSRRMVFVTATDLMTRNSPRFDVQTAWNLFGLSRAEHALCVRLLLGDTLAEAADNLAVKKETVRSQIKAVFAKTGSTRQSELILMLINLPL